MMITQRTSILLVGLVLASTVFSQTSSYDPGRLYPKDSLRADLGFVKGKLEGMHSALYRYVSKLSLDVFFDSLDHALVRPMKEQEFLSLLTLLDEKIGDGHTMFLPGDAAMEYNSTRGRFLPFSVESIDGKLYIVGNYSRDSSIQRGEEILRINGV